MKKIIYLMVLLAVAAARGQYSYETRTDFALLRCINYDLVQEDVLYALTGFNHIVVSYDNGATWDEFYSFPNTQARLDGLKVVPGSENLSFFINSYTEDDGLYLINIESQQIIATPPLPTDAVNPIFDTSQSGSGYTIYDSEANTILLRLTTETGYEVYLTSTAGESWTKIYDSTQNANVAPGPVAFASDDPSIIFIGLGPNPLSDAGGGLLISQDYGVTWSLKHEGKNITAIGFNPQDTNEVMVSSGGFSENLPEEIFRSTDGGQTWISPDMTWYNYLNNNVKEILFHPSVSGVIYIFEENQILFTADNGVTWDNTVYNSAEYLNATSVSLNPFYQKEVVIATAGFPYRTTNGGISLQQVMAPFTTIRSLYVERYGNTEHLFYSAQGGHLHKNYATGVTEAHNLQDFNNTTPIRNQGIPDPHVSGRVFIYDVEGVFGGAGKLYLSTDFGATRSEIFESPDYIISAVWSNPAIPNDVYIVLVNYQNSTLYHLDLSDTENITYSIIPTPADINDGTEKIIRRFLTQVTDSGIEFLLSINNELYKSFDQGATWELLFTIPEDNVTGQSIRDISINPLAPSELALASENGIYISDDFGQTWTLSLDTRAVSVAYSDANEGVMAIGIAGDSAQSGYYIKYFNGEDWVTVSEEELHYVECVTIDFSFTEGHITAYLATTDMGVVRYLFEIGELGVGNPPAQTGKTIIYPNPVTSLARIKIDSGTIQQISLFDVKGQLLFQDNGDTLDLSALASGVYILRILTQDGSFESHRLIKE